MRESYIEKKLRDGVKARGGLCLKLSPQFFEGMPDRLVVLPGRVVFVEMKGAGGAVRKRQRFVHEQFAALGHTVRVIKSTEEVNNFLNEIG